MPARDNIHHLIKAAIVNDGWQITAEPYVISYGERFLFVDLAAIQSSGVIGAEREGKSILVPRRDAKSFASRLGTRIDVFIHQITNSGPCFSKKCCSFSLYPLLRSDKLA